jgi:uncharacterized surface protein with fasciclin (FAS1) repeats
MKKLIASSLTGVALAATLAACGGSSSSSSTTTSTASVAAASASTAASTPAASSGSNIVQTAVAAGQFKTLVSLVKQAGLAGALSGPGPLTVLAPTDAAFAKVPKATLTALAHNEAKLKAVLLYHVVKGDVTAAQVVKLKSAKTLEGGSLTIHVSNGKVYVGDAQVIKPDVMASNGVIHVINQVLIPAS